MKKSKNKIKILIFITTGLFILAGISTNINNAGVTSPLEDMQLNLNDQPYKDSLTVGTYSGPIDLDPLNAWDTASNNVIRQTVEGLYMINYSDPDLGRIPMLAVDDGVWSDDKTWIVNLRQGVFFHDGTKFNATALKWNFDRLNWFLNASGNLNHMNETQSSTTSLYMLDAITPIIKNVTMNSEYQVTFYLNDPFGPFLDLLTFIPSYILSPSSTPFYQHIDTATGDIVGTGPFVYDNYTANTEVQFHRWYQYWRNPAQIEYLSFSIIEDEAARNNAMLAGDIDVLLGETKSLLPTFRADPDITAHDTGPGFVYYYLGMNNKQINATYREAISYAFDYDYMIEELLQGQGMRAYSPLCPSWLPGFDQSTELNTPIYNVTHARKILIDADCAGGLTLASPEAAWQAATLATFKYSYNTDNQFRVDLYPLLRDNLDEIGITVIDDPMTWEEFIYTVYGYNEPGGYDSIQLYWVGWGPDYMNAWNMLNPLFNPLYTSNSAQVDDPFVTFLLNAASKETDAANQTWIVKQILGNITGRVYPHVFGYHPLITDVYSNKLHGYASNTLDDLYVYPCYWELVSNPIISITYSDEDADYENGSITVQAIITDDVMLEDPVVIKFYDPIGTEIWSDSMIHLGGSNYEYTWNVSSNPPGVDYYFTIFATDNSSNLATETRYFDIITSQEIPIPPYVGINEGDVYEYGIFDNPSIPLDNPYIWTISLYSRMSIGVEVIQGEDPLYEKVPVQYNTSYMYTNGTWIEIMVPPYTYIYKSYANLSNIDFQPFFVSNDVNWDDYAESFAAMYPPEYPISIIALENGWVMEQQSEINGDLVQYEHIYTPEGILNITSLYVNGTLYTTYRLNDFDYEYPGVDTTDPEILMSFYDDEADYETGEIVLMADITDDTMLQMPILITFYTPNGTEILTDNMIHYDGSSYTYIWEVTANAPSDNYYFTIYAYDNSSNLATETRYFNLTGTLLDTNAPDIIITYYDLETEYGTGDILVFAGIVDDVMIQEPIMILFYTPNGTEILTDNMISNGGSQYEYIWNVTTFPIGDNYYFTIIASDSSNNSATETRYFNIIQAPVPSGEYELEWYRLRTGEGTQGGKGVAVDFLGNSYQTGYIMSGPYGRNDIILIKTSSTGVQQWSRLYGGAYDDVGMDVTVDSLGNIYVIGTLDSYSSVSNEIIVLLKYDNEGNLIWTQTWDDMSRANGRSIAIDSQDNICLAGYAGDYPNDFVVIKYNSNGTKLWDRVWGGSLDEGRYGCDIALDSQDNIYLTGYSTSFGGDSIAVLVKYNDIGEQLWNTTWGGSEIDGATALVVDNSDNIYVGGYTDSFGTGSYRHLFLLKYDNSGNQLWNTIWDSGFTAHCEDMAVDSLGNIFLTGRKNTGSMGELFFLIMYNNSGNLIWETEWGSQYTDFCDASGIAIDLLDNIYVSGYTDYYDGISDEMVLLKYSKDTGVIPDTTDPVIIITQYDDNLIYGSGIMSINATIFDNIMIQEPVYIQFFTPTGTEILSDEMTTDGTALHQYLWNASLHPLGLDYYYTILAYDTSGNSASETRYFNIILNGTVPGSYIISPFVIDQSGSGDYTWNQAASEPWCSGTGTVSDPYIIENLIINGNWIGSGITVKNSNVYFIIRNCVVYCTGSGSWPNFEAGIKLVNTYNGKLIDNYCYDNLDDGIFLDNSDNNHIIGNIAGDNNKDGIYLYNSHNNYISDNYLDANGDHGIYLRESSSNIIEGNFATTNRNGIFVHEGDYNQLIRNELFGNTYSGIYFYGGFPSPHNRYNTISENNIYNNYIGISLSLSDYNAISQNIIFGNSFYGISMHGTVSYSTISENIVDSNYIGIYLNQVDFNTISENYIWNSTDTGIMLINMGSGYSADNNDFYLNYFIGNTRNAVDNGVNNQWDNGIIGNYWDDYNGVDDNDDGIGDTPYVISGAANSTDNYPIWDDPDISDETPPVILITYYDTEAICGTGAIFIEATITDDDKLQEPIIIKFYSPTGVEIITDDMNGYGGSNYAYTWNVSMHPPGDGYYFTIYAFDNSTNFATETRYFNLTGIILDTTAPTIKSVLFADESYNTTGMIYIIAEIIDDVMIQEPVIIKIYNPNGTEILVENMEYYTGSYYLLEWNASVNPPGDNYYFTVFAYDTSNNMGMETQYFNLTEIPPDTIDPEITIEYYDDSVEFNIGTLHIEACITDNFHLNTLDPVQISIYQIDGTPILINDSMSNTWGDDYYYYDWSTSGYPSGDYYFTIVARDSSNNIASETRYFNILPDPNATEQGRGYIMNTKAPYSWIEISGSGTNITGIWDYSILFSEGGWDFTFYETVYDSLHVFEDGFMSFSGSHSGINGIPGIYEANFDCVALFNTNMYGEIYYEFRGAAPNKYLVIEYSNMYSYTYGPYPEPEQQLIGDFEVIFFEDGVIKFQYKNVSYYSNPYGFYVSIGLDHGDLTNYNSYDPEFPLINEAIEFTPCDMMEVDHSFGVEEQDEYSWIVTHLNDEMMEMLFGVNWEQFFGLQPNFEQFQKMKINITSIEEDPFNRSVTYNSWNWIDRINGFSLNPDESSSLIYPREPSGCTITHLFQLILPKTTALYLSRATTPADWQINYYPGDNTTLIFKSESFSEGWVQGGVVYNSNGILTNAYFTYYNTTAPSNSQTITLFNMVLHFDGPKPDYIAFNEGDVYEYGVFENSTNYPDNYMPTPYQRLRMKIDYLGGEDPVNERVLAIVSMSWMNLEGEWFLTQVPTAQNMFIYEDYSRTKGAPINPYFVRINTSWDDYAAALKESSMFGYTYEVIALSNGFTMVQPYFGGNGTMEQTLLFTSDGILETVMQSYNGDVFSTFKLNEFPEDTNPPSTSLSLSGTMGLNGWYVSNVSLVMNAMDYASGIKITEYSLDGINWIEYSEPITIVNEGSTTIYYRSIDNAGNVEMTKTEIIEIDISTSLSTINLDGIVGLDGWYTSDVSISLNSTDAYSGVNIIEYSLDGVNWIMYSGSFLISSEGLIDVYYRSIDYAGNIEMTQMESFKIDSTAPTSYIYVFEYAGPDGWFESDVLIVINATDSHSGVAITEYSFDGVNWVPVTSPIIISDEGRTEIYSRAIDNAGNIEIPKFIIINIDLSAPISEITIDGTMGLEGWYVSDVEVSINATDAYSGVNLIEYSLDGVNWNIYSGTVLISSDGWKEIYYRSIDYAGNVEVTKSESFKVDLTAPLSLIIYDGVLGLDMWYRSSVSVDFNFTDAYSGVNFLEYSLDGINWTTYTSSFLIADEGMTDIYFRATDNAGNIEIANNRTIKIDLSTPISSIYIAGILGLDGWYVSDVSVHINATDTYSGVILIEYSLDGVNWTTYYGSIMVSSEGLTTVYCRASDIAGNLGTESSVSFQIDKTAPTTTITLDGTMGLNDWYVSDVSVYLNSTDALSGLDIIEYSLDEVNWITYSGSILIADEGLTTIYYRSIDNAGNVETMSSETFQIDILSPITNISIDGMRVYKDWYDLNVLITLSAIDHITEVSTTEYSLDGVNWIIYNGSFNIPYYGIVSIYYNSTDIVGNIETTKISIIKILETPIKIDDTDPTRNWANTAANNEWCSGSGTVENPYIIEDMTINGYKSGHCIEISYSSAYFIIRNCTLYNGGFSHNGINLYKVHNGKIIDNNCSYNDNGIYTHHGYGDYGTSPYGYNIIISNNVISNNRRGGIEFDSFHEYCIISGNTIFNNGMPGIALRGDCNYNIIWNNTISNSGYDGIRLHGRSDNNIVKENKISISYHGIALSLGCINNTIQNNSISQTQGSGIEIQEDSHSNNIVDNIIENSNEFGIKIRKGSSYNLISNNIVKEGGIIYFHDSSLQWYSTDNYFLNNVIINNEGPGITIIDAENYIISGNTIISGDTGIILSETNNTIIIGNTIVSASAGVYLSEANNTMITGNIITDCQSNGILLGGFCFYNEISDNQIMRNSEEGIRLEGDNSYNTISNNSITNNFDTGLLMEGYCNFNTISNNNISYNMNWGGIALFDHCTYTIISENIINHNLGNAGITIYESNGSIISNNILSYNNNGIDMNNCGESLITENFIEYHDQDSIRLVECFSSEISDNDIYESDGIFIYIKYCESSIFVLNNNIDEGCGAGIVLYMSNNVIVRGNLISNTYDEGIILEDSNDNTILGNTIRINAIGLQGIVLIGSSNNFISGNIMTSEEDSVGIRIEYRCHYNIIHGNLMSSLWDGISFTGQNSDRQSRFNIISENLFINNTRGINILSPFSTDNYIYNNIFIGNTEYNALDDGTNNFWDNGTIGNYWYDYPGRDANDDGIGDTPYIIPGNANSTDNFPIWDDGQDVFPPSRYLYIVIELLVNIEVPENVQHLIDKAILFLTQAKDKFESGMIYEAFDKLKDAVGFLMEAGDLGANTQEIVDSIIFLVQYIVEDAMEKTIDIVGEDNKFIIRALEDYDMALLMIEMEDYGDAVKFFKDSLRNIMKARCKLITESFVSDLINRVNEIQELMTDSIPPQALNSLEQAEHMVLLAIEQANASLLESSLYKLKEAVSHLLDAQDYDISTSDIIEAIMNNIDDVVYLKIVEAESLLMGESNRHLDKAWTYYNKARDLWNDDNYLSAINYFAKVLGKVNDALK